METIREILRSYRFTEADEKNRKVLAGILLPESGDLAEEFYAYLASDPQTAAYFPDERAVQRRKETLESWFHDLLTAPYDGAHLRRLERIGKVHVRVGLRGHYVNAAMHFIRDYCRPCVTAATPDRRERDRLLGTLDKVLDINLDVLTSSYREEELKQVFVSRRLESALIQWAERVLYGLNLILMVGLLAMAVGILALFVHDVVLALSADLEKGVVTALGSLLVLWMMIELLHAEVGHLRGGRFHVRIFLELALVAFIRKLFIAALEHTDPVNFALLLGALLVLGILLYLFSRTEARQR
ncbi:MAG: protoglobin domain-containing protein [Deferrisomatales bacterium]